MEEGSYAPEQNGRRLVYDPHNKSSRAIMASLVNREYLKATKDSVLECSSANRSTSKVTNIVSDLDDIFSNRRFEHPVFLSPDEINKLPQKLRSTYEGIIKSPKIRGIVNSASKASYHDEMAVLHSRWSDLQKKSHGCSKLPPPACDLNSKAIEDLRSTVVAKVEENYNQSKSRILSAGNLAPPFIYFKKISKFMINANAEQKNKFEGLVDCELSPM